MRTAFRATLLTGLALSAIIAAPSWAAGPNANGVGTITEFSIPDMTSSQESMPSITLGPDGNLWFPVFNQHHIERITPAGVVTAFAGLNYPKAITKGPDGAMWAAGDGGIVVRMTTDGTITNTYDTNSIGDGITTGPDGNLWVSGGGTITRLTPGGDMTDFPVDGYALNITAGPDGNLWFTNPADFYRDGRIGRITPSGVVTQFQVPTNPNNGGSEPWGITTGPDGNIWFADVWDQIGKVTPAGEITMFVLPGPGPGSTHSVTSPLGITTGPDGNLWFTVNFASRIVRMTTQGERTGYALPAPFSGPNAITTGPHNTLWFTEDGANGVAANRIGTLKVCGSTCSLPSTSKPK